MAQAVGFSRALATVRRTVAARRDAERRARAVRIPPCNPCIVCRKNNKQHPARYCFWRRRWDSNPRDIAVKLISSQSRYDRFDTSAYLVLPHRLAQRLEKCEISMQDNDERLGTRHPIKPAVMGFPADKVTCRMQTFECSLLRLLAYICLFSRLLYKANRVYSIIPAAAGIVNSSGAGSWKIWRALCGWRCF